MNNKIFIGNLSYDLIEDDVVNHFQVAGSIKSVKIIKDRDSGRSKGFGFVEFAQPEAAKLSVETLDQTDLNGRPVAVSYAKEKTERPERNYNSNQRDYNRY